LAAGRWPTGKIATRAGAGSRHATVGMADLGSNALIEVVVTALKG
jgi:hypothetical protein